jgi:hypothetical protein
VLGTREVYLHIRDRKLLTYFFYFHPQVGLTLNGVEVIQTIIGGPAYTSRQIGKGDILLSVDGEPVTDQTVGNKLVGTDRPGDPVVVKVGKGGKTVSIYHYASSNSLSNGFTRQDTVVEVSLIRMASSDIKEREKLFEMFEKMKVYMIPDSISGISRFIDLSNYRL